MFIKKKSASISRSVIGNSAYLTYDDDVLLVHFIIFANLGECSLRHPGGTNSPSYADRKAGPWSDQAIEGKSRLWLSQRRWKSRREAMNFAIGQLAQIGATNGHATVAIEGTRNGRTNHLDLIGRNKTEKGRRKKKLKKKKEVERREREVKKEGTKKERKGKSKLGQWGREDFEGRSNPGLDPAFLRSFLSKRQCLPLLHFSFNFLTFQRQFLDPNLTPLFSPSLCNFIPSR